MIELINKNRTKGRYFLCIIVYCILQFIEKDMKEIKKVIGNLKYIQTFVTHL